MVVGWMIFHKEEAYKSWNLAVRGKNMKEKVFNYLTTVPKGKVVTYGQIASYLGNRKLARVVGNILHNNPDKNKFNVKSNTNEKGLLNYQVYMEIDSVDKVDEAYDLYYDFVNKTGNNYINYWGIYVVYNGTNHQLTINKDRTLEENKQNVKDNINFIEGHKNK